VGKKLSRRDFAKTSMAAGAAAAAAALPATLVAKGPAVAAATAAGNITAAAAGAAVARRRRITMPPEVTYGGMNEFGDGRSALLENVMTPAGQTPPNYPGGWKEGTTIPIEYYIEEKHYLNDERFLADNFWFMVDHHSRIPKPGDYFIYEFGRGESVIVLRDQAGEVKAFHNICRHRGSRLCQHGFDEVRPTEALPDGKPADKVLSMVQLGPSGNTPVFRCVYHAWTYDLTGKLVSFPTGMPNNFNPEEHALHPCHVRTVQGFIWLSLARNEPPDFEPWIGNWKAVADKFEMANLKIGSRLKAPTRANWKLVIENFRECYHCYPSHTKSYSVVHQIYGDPATVTAEHRARVDAEIGRHGHPARPRGPNAGPNYGRGGDSPTREASGGMGGGQFTGTHLKVGYVTGSLDGKSIAPLLPTQKEWSHHSHRAVSGFSTSWMMAYDDHVAVVRFTPRDIDSTDAEIFWLVHPDAKAGKDYDEKRLQALWGNTYREDRWICENQHFGIKSSRYNFRGAQPYAAQEGGPASFIQWYMREVAPGVAARTTNAL
jgi:phenylpropionate dioxygenase-like ring-hydroxylating dioxygenase large terminal subunit